jgi:CHAT domain-containing protein
MRPIRQKEDGTIEERSFLGVEHSVGRWLNLHAGEPPQVIQVTKVVAIAPRYPLPLSLSHAEEEAKWLSQQIGAVELAPATKDTVLEFLKNGEAHIIHFSCHGKSSEDANVGEILLEDGPLSAFELESREIRFGLPAKCHPLVFINACESGRTGLTLGGVGGLASAFVDISCGAVIGTLWSVDDKDAFDVVQMFYSYLLEAKEPLSIADIMRKIRKEFDRQKRDTFLAYTFFGDPHATVALRQIPTRARRGG